MKQILGRALSPSLAISALALSLALGGGTVWAAGLISTSQIQNGAVTTPKLADGAVTAPKLAAEVCHNVTGFKNGWKNLPKIDGFHAAQFCTDALGFVHLEGVLTGGTASTVAFRLPKFARPRFNHAFAVAAGFGSPALEDVDVFANGDVFLNGAVSTAVALDGVTFKSH